MEGLEFKFQSFLPGPGSTFQPRRQRLRPAVLSSSSITGGPVKSVSDSEDLGPEGLHSLQAPPVRPMLPVTPAHWPQVEERAPGVSPQDEDKPQLLGI